VVSGRVAGDNPTFEVPKGVRQDRGTTHSRLPSLIGELVDASPGLGAEVTCQLELALAQDTNGKCACCGEKRKGCVTRVYTEGNQKGIKAYLGDPGGSERIPLAGVSYPDYVEAVRKPAK